MSRWASATSRWASVASYWASPYCSIHGLSSFCIGITQYCLKAPEGISIHEFGVVKSDGCSWWQETGINAGFILKNGSEWKITQGFTNCVGYLFHSFPCVHIASLHHTTVVAKSFRTPRVCPLNAIVNKSCKIECCGNKMHQIIQNMILSWSLELKLSLL